MWVVTNFIALYNLLLLELLQIIPYLILFFSVSSVAKIFSDLAFSATEIIESMESIQLINTIPQHHF